MNKTMILPILASALMVVGCQQEAATDADAVTTAEAPLVLDATDKRLSYGIAFGLGGQLAQDGVPLNVEAFTAGLRDAVDGNEPKMTQEEITAEMQTYQQEQAERMQAEMAEAAGKNGTEGATFLAENATREGVVSLDSGLQYKILDAGDGAMPSAEDTVEVHYRGTLIDGTEFDSSYKRGETVKFGVTQVIGGWTEALQLMNVGAKWQLFIPADLAYGPAGAGGVIGPNATLLFDVELVGIEAK